MLKEPTPLMNNGTSLMIGPWASKRSFFRRERHRVREIETEEDRLGETERESEWERFTLRKNKLQHP